MAIIGTEMNQAKGGLYICFENVRSATLWNTIGFIGVRYASPPTPRQLATGSPSWLGDE